MSMNKTIALNAGLALTAMSLISFLLQANLDAGVVLQAVLGIVGFFFVIAIPVFYLSRLRKEQGGNLLFKDAFVTTIAAYAISTVITILFTALYVYVIDPGFVDAMVTKQIKSVKGFLESMPEEMMIKTLTDMERDTRALYTPLGLVKLFAIYMGVFAVISLILAAIMKKKPEYMASEAEPVKA